MRGSVAATAGERRRERLRRKEEGDAAVRGSRLLTEGEGEKSRARSVLVGLRGDGSR